MNQRIHKCEFDNKIIPYQYVVILKRMGEKGMKCKKSISYKVCEKHLPIVLPKSCREEFRKNAKPKPWRREIAPFDGQDDI